jgi:hypothetical protein
MTDNVLSLLATATLDGIIILEKCQNTTNPLETTCEPLCCFLQLLYIPRTENNQADEGSAAAYDDYILYITCEQFR